MLFILRVALWLLAAGLRFMFWPVRCLIVFSDPYFLAGKEGAGYFAFL